VIRGRERLARAEDAYPVQAGGHLGAAADYGRVDGVVVCVEPDRGRSPAPRRARPFTVAIHSASCALKQAGEADRRPGMNEVSQVAVGPLDKPLDAGKARARAFPGAPVCECGALTKRGWSRR